MRNHFSVFRFLVPLRPLRRRAARSGWLLVWVLAVAPRAAAQGGSTASSPAPPVGRQEARAADLAEEIALLRLIGKAQLGRETLAAIRPILAAGQADRAKADAAARPELDRAARALGEARRQVLKGEALADPTPAEVRAAGALARLDDRRAEITRQTADRVLQVLQHLGPEEKAAAVAAGQALVRDQRSVIGAQAAASMVSLGSPGTTQSLQRLRDSTPQQYATERMVFALRSANVPGWQAFRDQATGAAATHPGMQPPNLNDPAVQARMRPYLAMADQVRGMSADAFAKAQSRLAAQLDTARTQAGADAPVPPDEALAALAEALSGARGLAAVEARLGKPDAAR
jgi:hypothetical protein